MSLQLDQLPPEARALILGLQVENKLLREQIRLMLIDKFGPRSEKLSDLQLQLLEEEPVVVPAEVEQEAQRVEKDERAGHPRAPAGRREHPGRIALPADLERRVQTIPVPAAQCQCPQCQREKTVIGYQESEQLDMEPPRFFVRVTRREKRACRPCQEGVVTAPLPSRIIPKGKLGNELVVDLIDHKFGLHVPVYRQCEAIFRETGIELSRQTVCGVILQVGGLLEAIRQVLRNDLRQGGYIQVDETRFGVQSPETHGRNHTGQIWQYGRPGGPVVFDFQMTRAREGPRAFLAGFKGIVQSDGYSAYDDLGADIRYAACMAHVRRKVHDAHKVSPEDPVPRALLEQMGAIYAVEEEARQAQASAEQRLEMRRQRSRPLMAALRGRLVSVRQAVLPQSVLGRACDYALGQWTRLEVFLDHGYVEVDNNWSENAIRPVVLGRKNFLHIGSEWAGPPLAAIWTVYGTCQRLRKNPRAYLRDILPRLADWPANRVIELSPLAWNG